MTLTNAKKGQEVLVKEIGGSPRRGSFWRRWDSCPENSSPSSTRSAAA